MNQWARIWLLIIAVIIVTVEPGNSQVGESVTLIVSGKATAPILFGAADLENALKGAGFSVKRSASLENSASVAFLLGTAADNSLASVRNRLNAQVPGEAESFVIKVSSEGERQIIAGIGRDDAGCMYAAFEIAEQLGGSSGKAALGNVREKTAKPFLKVRGTNPFLTHQALTDTKSWYHSDRFWQAYFDTLARNRYNFVDIHGGFDLVSTGFPNLYLYMVKLDEYPDVGVDRVLADANLKRFRKIVQMAADRGIRVGFMNYSTETTFRLSDSPRDLPRWTSRPPAGRDLPGDQKVDYTKRCIKKFLESIPELKMFGFRVGESGESPEFFEKTYLPVIEGLGRDIVLYARTWGVPRDDMQRLAAQHPGRFYAEAKWVGEYMALPYQGITGRDVGGMSYDDYTDLGQKYTLLWHIRSNSTHRFFPWGDPVFAKRAVRACQLGEGIGFSMEEFTSTYPQEDVYHRGKEHDYFEWWFQRYWLWHMIWGRTGYDPDIPEGVFIAAFEKRLGKAGAEAFGSVVEMSKIVPNIHAFHSSGLGHRHDAPEFENGNGWYAPRIYDSRQRIPGNIDNFARQRPLDVTIMQDIIEYVDDYLEGKPNGKMTPLQLGNFLVNSADAALKHINNAEKLLEKPSKEFSCLKMDVQALNSLAHYYQAKIAAAVDLHFFYRTGDYQRFTSASTKAGVAIAHWDDLAMLTSEHYKPFTEMLRMLTTDFSWKEEGKTLREDLRRLNEVETDFLNHIPGKGQPPALGYTPIDQAQPGRDIRISATVFGYPDFITGEGFPQMKSYDPASIFKTVLYYRANRSGAFKSVPLKNSRSFPNVTYIYSGAIPAADVVVGTMDYYIEAGGADTGTARSPSDPGKYHTLRVSSDRQKPLVKDIPPKEDRPVQNLTVSAEATDNVEVRTVDLIWKVMPSGLPWQRTPMREVGENRYEATIPVTYHGVLYRFEAVDASGNAALYPDYLKETPYRVFKGWPPSEAELKAEGPREPRRKKTP
jgi:hypothetical protein